MFRLSQRWVEIQPPIYTKYFPYTVQYEFFFLFRNESRAHTLFFQDESKPFFCWLKQKFRRRGALEPRGAIENELVARYVWSTNGVGEIRPKAVVATARLHPKEGEMAHVFVRG